MVEKDLAQLTKAELIFKVKTWLCDYAALGQKQQDTQALVEHQTQLNAQLHKEIKDLRHDLQQNKLARDYAEGVTNTLHIKCAEMERELKQSRADCGALVNDRIEAYAKVRDLNQSIDSLLAAFAHYRGMTRDD